MGFDGEMPCFGDPLSVWSLGHLPPQSRLRRLYSLDYDAVISAVAGLQRTGLEASPLESSEIMPALCQGAAGYGM